MKWQRQDKLKEALKNLSKAFLPSNVSQKARVMGYVCAYMYIVDLCATCVSNVFSHSKVEWQTWDRNALHRLRASVQCVFGGSSALGWVTVMGEFTNVGSAAMMG